MLVKPSQLWSNLIKLGQTRFKLVLFGTGHYMDLSIEIVPGIVPMSRSPYRMAPIELKELKSQL